jgi:hypothetical protein
MRLALVLVLGGCAISQPVQPPVQGGIFVPETEPAAQGAASAAARSGCAPDGCYVGGLGEAICDVDQRRLQLLAMAAGLTNTKASYNAWWWPLGAVALYEKLRGAPSSSLLPPAALATGVFGYINSGHPRQADRYLGVQTGRLALVLRGSAPASRRGGGEECQRDDGRIEPISPPAPP